MQATIARLRAAAEAPPLVAVAPSSVPDATSAPSVVLSEMAPIRVSVRLFGTFEVRSPKGTLGPRDLGGGKARQVFEILVLNAGAVVTKARLIELLWPDGPPAEAVSTLESYVSVLRHKLLAVCSGRTDIVRTGVSGYVIDRGRLQTDVQQVATLVLGAQQVGPARAHVMLEQALAIAEQPLLPQDQACEWADEVRRANARRLLSARIAGAQAATQIGQTDRALELAQAALHDEPHSEAAWVARLTALERAGRHAEALRAYADCRRSFAHALGCSPGPLLQTVLHRLLNGAAEHDEDLGSLLMAVLQVRDHAAARAGAPGEPGSAAMPSAVQEAVQVLDALLTRARGERTAGASPRVAV